MIPFLSGDDPFPPVDLALQVPNGLLAAGADLSTERILGAYAEGIFPWFGDDDPILWWSPDPRMVLYASDVHVSRSLGKVLRSDRLRVTADTAFADVVRGCAEVRRDHEGTWITAEMEEAYNELARLGYGHSVEVWKGEQLVGGLYGVAIGRMFFGESMFSRVSDASKVALVRLARQLEAWAMPMIDCQMSTPHLASLGARDIPRADFVGEIRTLVQQPAIPGPWRFDL
ncbi:MAG TPA: leucyl/phenylalanyl-tRNA--protein transferase [Vicinamibacterales bacterium]|nr:leucyl/phenylalanyl-tRNA--protein transferase [Vicinamibacterales bacterium]